MCTTYSCVLEAAGARFRAVEDHDPVVLEDFLPPKSFNGLVSRRQQAKVAMGTRIAEALYARYAVAEKIRGLGGDPADTPLVICNRFANWDYVAETMRPDVGDTLDGVNSYVATAWFPATVQGWLTIEHGNKGEAITLASRETELTLAAILSLFRVDAGGGRVGVVVLGTFECVPAAIGGQPVAEARPAAFGALTVIAASCAEDEIRAAVEAHERMYADVAA